MLVEGRPEGLRIGWGNRPVQCGDVMTLVTSRKRVTQSITNTSQIKLKSRGFSRAPDCGCDARNLCQCKKMPIWKD